jgi:hypothetical protein
MSHSMVLFVHLQYDAPDSPQSRALRALAATGFPGCISLAVSNQRGHTSCGTEPASGCAQVADVGQ